jgi:hypothetical protein
MVLRGELGQRKVSSDPQVIGGSQRPGRMTGRYIEDTGRNYCDRDNQGDRQCRPCLFLG